MGEVIFTRAATCENSDTPGITARFDRPIWLIVGSEEFSSFAFATVSKSTVWRAGYCCTFFQWQPWQQFFCTGTVTANYTAANGCSHAATIVHETPERATLRVDCPHHRPAGRFPCRLLSVLATWSGHASARSDSRARFLCQQWTIIKRCARHR